MCKIKVENKIIDREGHTTTFTDNSRRNGTRKKSPF